MRRYWYDTIKASNHEELREFINTAAEQGWEPVECWSAVMIGTLQVHMPNATDHFCLLRMPVSNGGSTP